MNARFLTASDVGRALGLTPGAIRQMYKRGDIAVAERTEGGVNLFLRSEVERVRASRDLRAAGSSPADGGLRALTAPRTAGRR
jgi:DNA-binding transcriptional MerR regulator